MENEDTGFWLTVQLIYQDWQMEKMALMGCYKLGCRVLFFDQQWLKKTISAVESPFYLNKQYSPVDTV